MYKPRESYRDKTGIEEFLNSDKARELKGLAWYFGFDNNQNPKEQWDIADLRILNVYLTPGCTRAVSNTYTQIDSLVHLVDDGRVSAFIDYSYFPVADDMGVFEKYHLPLLFGNISHEPVWNYDVIFVSHSIILEFVNMFHALKGSGIPVYHKERFETEGIPLILTGGIPVQDHDSMGGNTGVSDLIFSGYGEGRIPHIVRDLIKFKKKYGDTRTIEARKTIVKFLVQKYPYFYYPAGYRVRYDGAAITKVTPIRSWVPEKVQFNAPHKLDWHPAFENKIFPPEGGNSATTDLLISHGCSGAFGCNFSVAEGTRIWTVDGACKIESMVGRKIGVESIEPDLARSIYEQRLEHSEVVVLSSGVKLECSIDHRWMVLNEYTFELEERKTLDLRAGDVVLKKLGATWFGPYQTLQNGRKLDEGLAGLTGFIHGDGHIKEGKRHKKAGKDQLFVYMTEEESYSLLPILDALFGPVELRPFYEKENGELIYEWRLTDPKDLEIYKDQLLWHRLSHEIEVPDLIFKSPESVISAYLRGYFQADGWPEKQRVGLTSISEKGLRGVQELLLMLEVDSHVGEYTKASLGRHDRYVLDVTGIYRPLFMERVGFLVKDFKYQADVRGNQKVRISPEFTTWIRKRHKGRESLTRLGLEEIHRPHKTQTIFMLRRYFKEFGELPGVYALLGSGRFVSDQVVGFEDGKNCRMFDVETQRTELCVYGGILTHNCAEGTICGGWRERGLEFLKKMMDEAVIRTACNTVKFYSFNISYYGRFVDMIYEASKRFSKVALTNMRVDMIAEAPDYFDTAVACGTMRASAPIEGFGERIRNAVLNKSLSRDQIMRAFRTFYNQNVRETKVGMILCGLETEEDFKDAISEFEEILRIRDEEGSKAVLRCNCTPLVIYPHTPLRAVPQTAAYNSLTGKKGLKELVRHFRGRIRFKFNGQRQGTFLEQMALDLGRLGTRIWEKIADDGWIYYGSPSAEAIRTLIRELKERYNVSPVDFMHQKSDDWIYPTDMIAAKNETFTKLAISRVGKQNTKPCTKTPANMDPKCHNCGFCKTQTQKDAILKRNVTSTKTKIDVQEAIFKNKALSAVRVTYQVPDYAFMWSKKAFSHLIGSKILQTLGTTTEKEPWTWRSFHSIKNYTSQFVSRANLRSWVSGNFSFDMRFKTNNLPQFDIEKINSLLKDVKVVKIVPVFKSSNLARSMIGVYEIYTKEASMKFKQALVSWRGVVKFADNDAVASHYQVMFKDEPLSRDDFKLFVHSVAGGSKAVLVAPAWVSPHNFLQTLFNLTYEKSLRNYKIRMFGLFTQDVVGRCKCGGDTYLYVLDQSPSPICMKCLAKGLLKRD